MQRVGQDVVGSTPKNIEVTIKCNLKFREINLFWLNKGCLQKDNLFIVRSTDLRDLNLVKLAFSDNVLRLETIFTTAPAALQKWSKLTRK